MKSARRKSMSIIDKDIMNTINSNCFNIEESLDTTHAILHHLDVSTDLEQISMHYSKLKDQHCVLSTKIIMLILQKKSLCEKHLQIVTEIQQNLNDTVGDCKKSRTNLNLTFAETIFSSLKIFYLFRKRKIIGIILKFLHNIKKVWRTMDKIQQLLLEQNFPKLVSTILEFQKTTEAQKQYICMVALRQNLNDLLEQVETNLDVLLANISINFDISIYASIFTAYQLLGKSQAAIDQLHMHFTAAVHNVSLICLLKYAKTEFGKQFSTVCRLVPLSYFIPCLVELCSSLLNILKSYCLLVKWHNQEDNIIKVSDGNHKLSIMNQQYISYILENGIHKICCDIIIKIKTYFEGFELKSLKIEEFLYTLHVIEGLSKHESFIQNKAEDQLQKYVERKFLEYLQFYHAVQLDELKTYIENDGWAICPIKSVIKFYELDMSNLSGDKLNNTFTKIELNPHYYDYTENLRTIQKSELHDLEVASSYQFSEDSDDGDLEDVMKCGNVDAIHLKNILRMPNRNYGPIVTNTTLGVLRVCTKYVQAMSFLHKNLDIILLYIRHLFELYLYGVHNFFASDLMKSDFGAVYSTNLKRTISYIKDNFILEEPFEHNRSFTDHKIKPLQLSSAVDLNDSSTFFGLEERIVAVESLIFFGFQLQSMRDHFNYLISDNYTQQWLDKFYCQTIHSAVDMRKPIFTAAVSKIFVLSDLIPLINNVEWEQTDVSCQHSYYIDFLFQKIFQLKLKLEEIQQRVPFNTDTISSLWDCVAYVTTHLLVDAYATIKKCSNGGRALMQLDLAQFVAKYETITSVRPMPHQNYVASYIKAYYLPELSVEVWMKEHQEYTAKHLMGLFSSMPLNKRLKQKLSAVIEDMHRQEY